MNQMVDRKGQLVELYLKEEGYKVISKVIGLSVFGVRNIINNWKVLGTIDSKEGSGGPKKLTERARRLLLRSALKDPSMGPSKLGSKLSV